MAGGPNGALTAGKRRFARPRREADNPGVLPLPDARHLASLAALLLLLAGVAPAPARAADGPGLGNLQYDASELFQPISVILSEPFRPLGPGGPGIPVGHGNVVMVNGYLMVITSFDSGGISAIGTIEFWDVSDPRNPFVASVSDTVFTKALREPHGFSLARVGGRDVLAAQGVDGVLLFDVTDPMDVQALSYLDLPDIQQGDYTGDWWVFWQAPWLYVAGTGSGLYVVDASDPADPVLVNRLPPSETAGLSPGQVFAIGNLLVLMKNEGGQFVTMDIGDPVSPTLLHSFDGMSGYSHIFAAGQILTSGDSDRRLHVHDVGHDGSMSFVGSAGSGLDKGGYGSYQDGFFLGGFSKQIAKMDIAQLTQLGTGSTGIVNRDEDFGQVVGNLVFGGDDHGVGSGLYVHQTAPDLVGPDVHFVHPADGATGQPLSTRVGLSLSDHVDLDSLDAARFAVRRVGDSQALPGTYSVQFGLVNFTPDAPLLPDTEYEVVVDGIVDWAGNAGGDFQSRFTTTPDVVPTCVLDPPNPVEVGVQANLSAVTSGVQPLTLTWDFGDGTAETVGGAAITHAYAEAGRFAVVLRVDGPGGSSSCAATQIAHHPITTLSPTSATPIVHDGRFAWNVNPDNDTVTATDDTPDVAFEVPVGANPRTLAIAPDGSIWVASQDDATVHVLSPSGSPLAIHSLPRGSRPYGIAFRPDGAGALVTLAATGELVELTLAGQLGRRLAVGPRPRGLAISADSSRAYVSRFLSPADQGEVFEVDLASFTVSETLVLGFDPGPDTESSGRGVPNYLSQVRITPDGRRLLVPSKKDNVARGLHRDGQELTFESRVRPILSEIDLVSGLEDPSARVDLNDRDLPQAATTTPLGDALVVAVQGSNLVEVLDARTRERIGGAPTGRAPQGLAWSPGGDRLFVHNFMSRSVSVYDTAALVAGISNTPTLLGEVSTVANERLAPDVLAGKQIFYDASDPRMSRDGYISCASCHLDGGGDGQVWDFTQAGEGLRNTIALTGRGGTAQGNVHWTANFDEIQDFENDIRLAFSGAGFLGTNDWNATRDPLGAPKAGLSLELDQLAAYVTSLDSFPRSPYRAPDGALTAEGELGRFLFAQHDCGSCHAGPHLTDGLRHDVGTEVPGSGQGIGQPLAGVGFETPTLRGLWLTAPYLHAGQAATIADVLGDASHTGVALSSLEIQLIEAYLMQIDGSEAVPECADGIDNDGDGAVDFGADPECIWHLDGSEDSADACGLGFEVAPLLVLVAALRRRRSAR